MPAMNSYTLNLAFLFVALLCQVLISGTSIECWLRRDLPRRQRTTWLALSLAFTFALYGFIRKTVSVEALPGLFIETIVLIPFSLGWILWLYWNGEGFLCSPAVREGFLLFLAGPVTSLPLVMFAYAARHMRLMTLGLLQYISPTCTFFLGIFMFGETLNPAALVTFIFIWLALLLYTVESWRQTRHLPH